MENFLHIDFVKHVYKTHMESNTSFPLTCTCNLKTLHQSEFHFFFPVRFSVGLNGFMYDLSTKVVTSISIFHWFLQWLDFFIDLFKKKKIGPKGAIWMHNRIIMIISNYKIALSDSQKGHRDRKQLFSKYLSTLKTAKVLKSALLNKFALHSWHYQKIDCRFWGRV